MSDRKTSGDPLPDVYEASTSFWNFLRGEKESLEEAHEGTSQLPQDSVEALSPIEMLGAYVNCLPAFQALEAESSRGSPSPQLPGPVVPPQDQARHRPPPESLRRRQRFGRRSLVALMLGGIVVLTGAAWAYESLWRPPLSYTQTRAIGAEHTARREFREALRTYAKFLPQAVGAEAVVIRQEMAAMEYALEEYAAIIAIATPSLRIAPDPLLLRYRMAAYEALGQYAQALEDVRRAAQLGDQEAQRRLWARGERWEPPVDIAVMNPT